MNSFYRLLFSFLHIGFLTSMMTFSSLSWAQSVQQLEKECYEVSFFGGGASSCTRLGVMYSNGEGVRQDKFKAAELYQKGCDGAEAVSCYNLGSMYFHGIGVRQDSSRTLNLFGKACDLKDEEGCKGYAALKNRGIK